MHDHCFFDFHTLLLFCACAIPITILKTGPAKTGPAGPLATAMCMLLVNFRANIFFYLQYQRSSVGYLKPQTHKQLSDIKKVCGDHVIHALPAFIKYYFVCNWSK